MPELPEVETVVRLIRPSLEGRKVTSSRVDWDRTLGGVSRREFQRRLKGSRIDRIWRRAKFIVFDLSRDGRAAGGLVGHLRMTGRMHVEPKGTRPSPYCRVRLDLDNGQVFHFVDVRKFGRLVFHAEPDVLLEGLGPEPLEEEFTAEWLLAGLRSRKRMLKPLLLDQNFVAGLGNIYVDECLHSARLHPLRRSDTVASAAARRLWAAIRETLQEAIEREGSSFDTFYRTPEGQPGAYQHQFRVYGRTGKPCYDCGAAIARIVVAQRGTHLCRKCQRAPRIRA